MPDNGIIDTEILMYDPVSISPHLLPVYFRVFVFELFRLSIGSLSDNFEISDDSIDGFAIRNEIFISLATGLA